MLDENLGFGECVLQCTFVGVLEVMEVILFETGSEVIMNVLEFARRFMALGHVEVEDALLLLRLYQSASQLTLHRHHIGHCVSAILLGLPRCLNSVPAKLSQPLLKD